jgi:hypothetical protein
VRELRKAVIARLCTGYSCEALPAPGSPFHLALPVHDMSAARSFYGGVLGLIEGRRADDKWQVKITTDDCFHYSRLHMYLGLFPLRTPDRLPLCRRKLPRC